MTGQNIIDYIKKNNLQDAKVTVTATIYRQGDHDCRTTDNVTLSQGIQPVGKGKYIKTIELYIDSELY